MRQRQVNTAAPRTSGRGWVAGIGAVVAPLTVREGEQVRRGTVLAAMDTELLDHQIQTADTATRLHLQRQRERQVLRAPFDGWVLRTVYAPYELVPPGAPLVVLVDLRELTARVFLPEDRHGHELHILDAYLRSQQQPLGMQVPLGRGPFQVAPPPISAGTVRPHLRRSAQQEHVAAASSQRGRQRPLSQRRAVERGCAGG